MMPYSRTGCIAREAGCWGEGVKGGTTVMTND